MQTHTPGRTTGHLPAPLSSFIGRKRELAEICRLLRSDRLVTLTGAGGSGKTRLAIQAAAEVRDSFEDRAWLVELAPLADPELVAEAVATSLSVREQAGRSLLDTLIEHLGRRRLLLVLDNCEHLVLACAGLAEILLQACPHLTILATSREAHPVAGEVIRIIPPLSLPESRPSAPAAAQGRLREAESEAVQLFVARAKAASAGFDLTRENAALVADICLRLDGMPLAIELAAARLRALSLPEIAELLKDRFRLLTGGSRTAPARQRTLEATLDWSYALLSMQEQAVLQRLSVFAGGATLEAAQFLCALPDVEAGDVVDLVSRLVDKNLVNAAASLLGETRYQLLETVRQYALVKLTAADEMAAARDRHLEYFVQWAEQAEPYLAVTESTTWLNRFEAEHDNLRAALEWSLTSHGRAAYGLRLAAVAAHFWKLHGHVHEGRVRLAALLAHEGAQENTVARAKALFHACNLAFYQSDYVHAGSLAQEALRVSREVGPAAREVAADSIEMLAEVAAETGDYETATRYYEESLALSREAGYLKGIGENLKMLGWVTMRTGTLPEAKSMMEEALGMVRQSGNLHQITSALAGLGELAIREGQYERAREYLQEALTLAQQLGEKWALGIVLGSLGWLALRQGDCSEMLRRLEQSLTVRMESGDRGGTAWCLERLAEACTMQSRQQAAPVIYGAADALRASANSVMDAADRPDHDHCISELKGALGAEVFDAAWNEGRKMPLQAVVDYALAQAARTADGSGEGSKAHPGGLTARELETAILIAKGMSNREIAEAMTVGAKTVETYVTRILDKLGLRSRVQVATWAIQQGLAPEGQEK